MSPLQKADLIRVPAHLQGNTTHRSFYSLGRQENHIQLETENRTP